MIGPEISDITSHNLQLSLPIDSVEIKQAVQ